MPSAALPNVFDKYLLFHNCRRLHFFSSAPRAIISRATTVFFSERVTQHPTRVIYSLFGPFAPPEFRKRVTGFASSERKFFSRFSAPTYRFTTPAPLSTNRRQNDGVKFRRRPTGSIGGRGPAAAPIRRAVAGHRSRVSALLARFFRATGEGAKQDTRAPAINITSCTRPRLYGRCGRW